MRDGEKTVIRVWRYDDTEYPWQEYSVIQVERDDELIGRYTLRGKSGTIKWSELLDSVREYVEEN